MRRLFLLLWIACALLSAPAADAALRSPQVPVSGAALASFFASQSQTINPLSDQQDLQQLSAAVGASFELRAFGPDVAASAGAYNTLSPAPALYQIWPGSAASGWFTVSAFRIGPVRLVVNLFDNLTALQGTNTYLGADASAFGFYGEGAAGAVYLQDFRNPLGAARILAFSGTGARAGYTWFAIETGTTTGGDFADLILLVNLGLAPVDVERAKWGELKQRFR